MDPSGAFLQPQPQPQVGSFSFPRSSSNVSLSSLARSASGGSAGRGRGATRGRRMVRRVCRGVITFIFAIGTTLSYSTCSPLFFSYSLLHSSNFAGWIPRRPSLIPSTWVSDFGVCLPSCLTFWILFIFLGFLSHVLVIRCKKIRLFNHRPLNFQLILAVLFSPYFLLHS